MAAARPVSPVRLGDLGATLEHLGEVRPPLVAAVQPLERGERVVRVLVEVGGLLVGLDRLAGRRELALEQIAEAEEQIDLGRGVGLDLGVRAQRVGELRPLLLLALRLGERRRRRCGSSDRARARGAAIGIA